MVGGRAAHLTGRPLIVVGPGVSTRITAATQSYAGYGHACLRSSEHGETMADPNTPSTPAAQPGDPIDLATSVAGEEDPGASIDLANVPDRPARRAGQGTGQPAVAQPAMQPGDEAPAGTPGTGETVCPRCGGSGVQGGASCATCGGTGKVTVGIGGA